MIIQANKISIDFKDTDYAKGLGVSVQNATDGNISTTGIEYTRDCSVQKDMEKDIVYTDKDKSSLFEAALQELPQDAFDPADFISQSMTGEDAKEMDEEGKILEEYVASSLERAIQQIKGQRKEREVSIENYLEKGEVKQEFVEELEQRIREAIQMASGVQGMTEAVAKYFLENNLTPTPSHVQNAMGVVARPGEKAVQVPFEEMKTQVEQILAAAKMPVNEENMETAKWLYEQNLPVTEEHIKDYYVLQELSQLPEEILAERIRDDVLEGQIPEQADLTQISYGEAQEKKDRLVNAEEEIWQQVMPEDVEGLTARRMREEIRLHMTLDAVRVMEKNGISVEVDNLMQVVDELKQMEQRAVQSFLEEAGLPIQEDTLEMAGKTLMAREDIVASPVVVLGRTIENLNATIEDLAAEGNQLRMQMDSLAQQYETVGTQVRKDLGDSIKKAFGNVDAILEDLDMAPTAANQRAVRILAYNRMPLTQDAILDMKEYDEQVTTLMKNLKPDVVAELIRRQDNPLEMTVAELSEKVAQIQDEIQVEDVSFRKYLWKLDHHGDITPEERKSMIGIYRLLDKVEKSDGAVIGQVIKGGRELSFSSLLSAVRTRKAEGIDQNVDDEFGGLQDVVLSGERIHEQIRAGFGEQVVTQLQQNISPKVLHKNADSYMTDSLEMLLEQCGTDEEAIQENDMYYHHLAAEIRQMATTKEQQVMDALKALDLPESIQNIQLMKCYLEQGSKTFLKMYEKEEAEDILENLDEPEALEQLLGNLDDKHEGEIQDKKSQNEVTHEQYKELMQMASSISFYRQMRRAHKYEIPIVTDRGVTACSVTVLSGDTEKKGTVEIAMDSERFGKLQASFKVSGQKVSGFVTAETQEGISSTKEIFEGFEMDLEKNGLHMEREDFVTGKRHSFHMEDRENVRNETLYQVAKLFIQNVQKGEEMI